MEEGDVRKLFFRVKSKHEQAIKCLAYIDHYRKRYLVVIEDYRKLLAQLEAEQLKERVQDVKV